MFVYLLFYQENGSVVLVYFVEFLTNNLYEIIIIMYAAMFNHKFIALCIDSPY